MRKATHLQIGLYSLNCAMKGIYSPVFAYIENNLFFYKLRKLTIASASTTFFRKVPLYAFFCQPAWSAEWKTVAGYTQDYFFSGTKFHY